MVIARFLTGLRRPTRRRTISLVRPRSLCGGLIVAMALAACADGNGPKGSPELPDVARVVCDATGTHVETPSVGPQLDGVHVLIDNRLGFDSGFVARFDDGAGGGENAPRGESMHVLQAPPGHTEIGCFPDEHSIDEPDLKQLEIVDPQGLYRSTEIDCTSVSSGTVDYAEGVRGEKGDPVDLARKRFNNVIGLREDDVVELAGYPQDVTPTARLVRGGRTIGTITYRYGENGGWLEETLSMCDGLTSE